MTKSFKLNIKINIDLQEIREVSVTLAEVKPALTDKKDSPQKVKETIQIVKVESQMVAKPEQDSDTNSDECPEVREFEKISKKKLEDEMHEFSDIKLNKIEKLETEKQQTRTETEVRSKSLLDVVKKDNQLYIIVKYFLYGYLYAWHNIFIQQRRFFTSISWHCTK